MTLKLTPKAKAAVLDATPRQLPDWRGLLGHQAATDSWRTLAARDRLPQVMLLVGRSGVGKRALLAMHAALSLCRRRAEGAGACGVCGECRAVLQGSHPEVLWIEPDPETGKILIETAADLQDFLSLEPGSRGGRPGTRLALVADCDRMSTQAANRLLKTLEEPAARVRIVMTTSRPRAVLETVRSRCVAWRLTPRVEATLPWLAERLQSRGLETPDEASLRAWLKRAGLAPGEALRLALEAVAGGDVQTGLPPRLSVARTWRRRSRAKAGAA